MYKGLPEIQLSKLYTILLGYNEEDIEIGNYFRRIGGYWYRRIFFRYNFLYLFQYIIISYNLYFLISYVYI
jgi:hypothetical protein